MVRIIFLFLFVINVCFGNQSQRELNKDVLNGFQKAVKEYPYLTLMNYVNSVEVFRDGSYYSLYITQEQENLVVISVLRYDRGNVYFIIDEKMLYRTNWQDEFFTAIVKEFIVGTNPARELEK